MRLSEELQREPWWAWPHRFERKSVHHTAPERCRESHLIPKFEIKISHIHKSHVHSHCWRDESDVESNILSQWIWERLQAHRGFAHTQPNQHWVQHHRRNDEQVHPGKAKKITRFCDKLCFWESKKKSSKESSSPFSSVRFEFRLNFRRMVIYIQPEGHHFELVKLSLIEHSENWIGI